MKTPFLLILVALFVAGFPLLSGGSERPNIILIMVDDMGFSDLGYQGGEIDTPHLDALAHGGVRFSQFYNSGRCCPTRATLMTGLHPHQTGIGWMTEPAGSNRGQSEPPAYQGHLNESCVTVAEVLSEAGYATYLTGKWHLGYNERADWPLQRGFDRFYGCLSGATRFFTPEQPRGMSLDNERVDPVSTTDEAYYTTDAFTDYAIEFIDEHLAGEKSEDPYFLYLAYTAPHWPLQAFEDDIEKYRGNYKGGWEKLRADRFQRQIELGLVEESWELSPKTPGIPEWNSLSEAKKDEMDLKMAVYAAMVDRVDQNIGKLVTVLKENGTFDNTLLLFLSDNGACQEGGMLGRGEFYDIEKRNRQDANSYGEAWANAGSTPFRYYKHFAHEGGTATPFFLHWPEGIEPKEEWYGDPAQLIDILPTLMDVAGATYPEERDGVEVHGLDGVSLRPAFDGKPLDRSEPIFVEHERHAFARDGKWKLVGKDVSTIEGTKSGRWELYDMESDRTETNNLAKSEPKKLAELAAQWESWAEGVGVYPRGKRSPAPPTSFPAPAEKTEIKAERFKPQIAKTGFTIQAKVQAKEPEGVVLSQGGKAFGYSLYFEKGVPVFACRNRSELTVVRGTEPVKGKVTLDVKVNRNTIFLRVNSKEVGRAEIKGFLAEQPGLGLYLGADGVHPVGEYKVPNRFSGEVLDYRILSDLRKVPMRTRWGNDVDPETVWAEYPRPQLRRENWTNLNGHWSYAVTPQSRKKAPEKWQGEILVPFAIEAPLSGVERRLLPEEYLWYSREFPLEKKKGQRYLLHFEAVDYESKVWVNGTEVGSNTGGNLPFALDITDAAQSGSNEVVVRVSDGTDTGHQLHGKQVLNPGGIWYTPVSGIWQTVWMEEVPDTYLSDIKITTKTSGRVEIRLGIEGGGRADATATVRLGGTEMAGAKAKGDRIELSIPNPRLWSPDDPALYQVEITMGEDKVQSYFGIRETGIERDEEGHLRFTLNGKPLFHWGTLDQGWWPDGLLTPPSEDAMVYDIQYLKDAGFNTIRKHIKVEPRRYYYACDKIGMLLWQDQVSSGTGRKRGEGKTSPEWTRLEPGGADAEWPDEAHEQFMHELEVMIDTYHNHPSIVQWVPFNEAWGQHRTMKVGEWVVPYDPTRQINIASGGNFFPSGHIVDDHAYPHPEFDFESGANGRFDDFVKVMGEFGGHGFPVEGHLWSNETRNWGYGGIPKDKDEWLERYRTSIEMLADLKKRGIAGGIYTQTTDVEGEINGLITYDREVQKLKPEELREIGAILFDGESQ